MIILDITESNIVLDRFMERRQFYLEKFKKNQDKVIIFDQRVVYKLKKVLRVKKGEIIFVYWDNGYIYKVKILKVAEDKIVAEILKKEKPLFSLKKKIILCPSLLKQPKRFEFILEKGTEVGVNSFIPVIADRSVKRSVSGNQRSRWKKIVIEAADQAKRVTVPVIEKEMTFKDLLDELQYKTVQKIILTTNKQLNQDILKVIKNQPKEIYILIGPEGDWSDKEIDLAKKYGWSFASLGDFIFKSETAAIISAYLVSVLSPRNAK